MGGPESGAGPKKREALNQDERRKMESLREPMQRIMETLGPVLEEKQVAGIVVIDASGRVPGLLVSEIARRVQGERPPTHFIPSGGGDLMEKIRHMKLPKDGVILLVDDSYAHGGSLNPIEAELRAFGYVVQVVAFYNAFRRLLLKHPDAHYGIQDEGSDIHKTPTLSGVQNTGKPYATVLRSSQGVPRKRFAKKIAQARGLIPRMAEEIIAEYEREKE